MENNVLIISGYFFIAFIAMIIDYALRDSKYQEDEMDKIFEATLSICFGLLWVLLPVLLTFKFIDKYVRD